MPVEENILWEAIVFGPGQVYVGCIRVIIITLNLTKYSVNFEVLMLKIEVEEFNSMGSLKLKMADQTCHRQEEGQGKEASCKEAMFWVL